MKVVLRDDVENLGRKGDVVDVADGYARNYLVPRGLAMKATKGVVAQAESMRRNRAARDARERDAAQATATTIAGIRLEISARAGEGGKLFGSVTAADVAEALLAQKGVEVDRRRIGGIDEPVKELGEVEVEVTLHPDVAATFTVVVVAAG
jgi:large subunit ribosomal protein L9